MQSALARLSRRKRSFAAACGSAAAGPLAGATGRNRSDRSFRHGSERRRDLCVRQRDPAARRLAQPLRDCRPAGTLWRLPSLHRGWRLPASRVLVVRRLGAGAVERLAVPGLLAGIGRSATRIPAVRHGRAQLCCGMACVRAQWRPTDGPRGAGGATQFL